MPERLFTEEIAKVAGMARYDANDLSAILVRISGAPHTVPSLDRLHAELAWSCFDKLAEKMQAIPRPEKEAADRMAVLADPMRRAIFEMLADGPRSVGEIADRLPVTRPAVSQHLRALSDAGLVTHEPVGTRHLYRIEPERIAEVRDYLDRLWQKALANLKSRIEKPNQ